MSLMMITHVETSMIEPVTVAISLDPDASSVVTSGFGLYTSSETEFNVLFVLKVSNGIESINK